MFDIVKMIVSLQFFFLCIDQLQHTLNVIPAVTMATAAAAGTNDDRVKVFILHLRRGKKNV